MKKIKFDGEKLQLNKQKIAVLKKEEMQKLFGGLQDGSSLFCLPPPPPPPPPPATSDRLCGSGCTNAISGM